MVSAVRSVIYHADSGNMWRHILRKGGDVRKKQGNMAEEVPEIGEWSTRWWPCLRLGQV